MCTLIPMKILLVVGVLLLFMFLFETTCGEILSKPVDYSLTTILGGLNGEGLDAWKVGMVPKGLAFDVKTNSIYFADSNNNQIRIIDSKGLLHVFAGSPTFEGGTSPANTLANNTLLVPSDLSFNSEGNLFLLESGANQVRKVYLNETTGLYQMNVIAGGGISTTHSNISALSAQLSTPACLVFPPNSDEMFICEATAIRKVVNGTIYSVIGKTVAGTSADGTLADNALINKPYGIAFHPSSKEMYYTEYGRGAVRYIAKNGTLLTYSMVESPRSLVFSKDGDLFVCSGGVYNSTIVKISNIGVKTVIVNWNQVGGPPLSNACNGLAINGNNLYFSMSIGENYGIYSIDLSNLSSKQIGGDGSNTRYFGPSSGKASEIVLVNPTDTFYNSQDDQLLILDSEHSRILRMSSVSNLNNSVVDTLINDPATIFTSIVQSNSTGDIFIGSSTEIRKISKNGNLIIKVAGSSETNTGDLYPAVSARLSQIISAAISPLTGEIYLSNSNYGIRKIDSQGVISTIFAKPSSVFVNQMVALPNGDILFSDSSNHFLRKFVVNTGSWENIAGNGATSFNGDGILAKLATLYLPQGICVNATSGDIYIADYFHYRLRKISMETSQISTVAGNGNYQKTIDGSIANETSAAPWSVAIHPITGELYFSELFTKTVKRIDSKTGRVYTVIGNDTQTYSESSYANSTYLGGAIEIAFSPNGDLYVTCPEFYSIKKMNFGSDMVFTVAGTGNILNTPGVYVNGEEGEAKSISLSSVRSIFVSPLSGELHFAENLLLRKVSNNGILTTVAGGIGDGGPATGANIVVRALEISQNDLILSDTTTNRIRKINLSTGIISSIVGTNFIVDNGNNLFANQTNINVVNDLRIQDQYLLFTDSNNQKVRKTEISGAGKVITLAGKYPTSSLVVGNVLATDAYFSNPGSVAYLPNGDIIVADTFNHAIRKIDSNGYISLIAGKYSKGLNGDSFSDAKQAALNAPLGLSVLKDGRIIFSDSKNLRIRMLTPYCKDKEYSLVNSQCLKNNFEFKVLGMLEKQIISNSRVEFSLIIAKIQTNQSILEEMTRGSNSYSLDISIQSAFFSMNDTISGFTLKNNQNGISDIFPIISFKSLLLVSNSAFSAKVSLTLNSNTGLKMVSNSVISFLPPANPPAQLFQLLNPSNQQGIAVKSNISVNIFPWSASAELSPLLYAITMKSTNSLKESIRITEYSENLSSRAFLLPYLNENITLGLSVMDSLGNYYSRESDLQIIVTPFDGTLGEFTNLAKTSNSFNLVTILIYDMSFATKNTEYYSSLLSKVDINGADISNTLSKIQFIATSSGFDSNIANQTVSKLSDIVKLNLQNYNTSKSGIGYVSSPINQDNIRTILSLSSNTLTAGVEIAGPRKLTEDLAQILILSQLSKSIDNLNDLNYTTFTSQNINMTVSTFVIKEQINKEQFVEQNQIKLIFNASEIASRYSAFASECAISLLTFTNLFEKAQQENDSSIISQKALSITTDFKFVKDQQVLNLENLEKPIKIVFKLSSLENYEVSQKLNIQNSTYHNLSCTYLDEVSGKWSNKGCWLSNYDSSTGVVECSCNHTTLFTTFLEQKTLALSSSVRLQVSSMYYAQIAFGVFYLIISSIVLVMLFIFRKEQPVKSRLATPYLGTIALMLETALIYIVQRSVLVDQFNKPSTDWSSGDLASNWIANIVMIIVNTMQLTAVFSYVLQVSRFELMKYMHNILVKIRRNEEKHVFLSMVRKITSTLMFSGSVLIFGLLNVIYWTIWVILVRTNTIDPKTYTYIVSISYIILILSMGSIISLVSIADWSFSFIARIISDSKQKSELSKSSVAKNALEKIKHDIHSLGIVKRVISIDRPLFFRMEMILFCCSFVMLVLNQALGMSTLPSRFDNELGYLKIQTNDLISFIFELIYMAFHVLVYGGFCVLLVVSNKIRIRLRKSNQVNADENEDMKEMNDLLESEYGQSLFEEFCKKEFSTENLYLYQELKNKEMGSEHIAKIYEKYIKSGAEMEVNISSECSKKFTNLFKSQSMMNQELKEKSRASNSEMDEVIMDLKDNIIMNLSDTFSRFVFSTEYELFTSAFQLEQDLRKNLNLNQ